MRESVERGSGVVRRSFTLVLVALLAGPVAAVGVQQGQADPDRVPPALDHGWAVGSPSSVGFDPVALDSLARRMTERDYGQIDALLLVRNGRLVFERYFGGYTIYTLHTLQSITKSVAGTLLGIALHQGVVDSLDQPIHEFFPEHGDVFAADPRKRAITLRHVLSMTVGLDWPELGGDHYGAENIVWRLEDAYDWTGFVLQRPLAAEPGSTFTYNTGASNLIGAIIQNRSGLRADIFAERYLFDPLGIPNYGWWRNMEHPDHWVHTGGGLHLMPRDLAKIGYLYLNDGRWHGRQVLCPEWIAEATAPQIATGRSPTESYGYQWWLRPLEKEGGPGTQPNDVVHAWGLGGQHMFVIPKLDLVAVFTSTNFADAKLGRTPIDLLYDAIIPALRSLDRASRAADTHAVDTPAGGASPIACGRGARAR